MKRLALALVVAALASGCGTPAPTPATPDETYLATLRDAAPMPDVTDATAIEFGHVTCTILGGDMTRDRYMLIMLDEGSTATEASAFLSAATTAYCPGPTWSSPARC